MKNIEFDEIEIKRVKNGYVVYVYKAKQCNSFPDFVFVFNTLKDLSEFLLTFKVIENEK